MRSDAARAERERDASASALVRRSVRQTHLGQTANEVAQRQALAGMSECELLCGRTSEEIRADWQTQRARVLARYGVEL